MQEEPERENCDEVKVDDEEKHVDSIVCDPTPVKGSQPAGSSKSLYSFVALSFLTSVLYTTFV